MADRGNRSGWWDEFEELSSFSSDRERRAPDSRREPVRRGGAQSSSRSSARNSRSSGARESGRSSRGSGAGSIGSDWDLPQWEIAGRPHREPERTSRPPRPRPEPEPERRPRKPLRPGTRRALLAFGVLGMAAVTVLLAIFLLFKISDITVTGDAIEGFSAQQAIELCGYEIGDNLIFLPTRSKERMLTETVPYIGGAEIVRHLPGTLEIRLTSARVAACLSAGDGWLYISDENKVLEKRADVGAEALKVLGLTVLSSEAGQPLELDDESAQAALQTIVSAIPPALERSGLTGRFTVLDMSDLSVIRLFYEDRVEFLLGNVLDLQYKAEAGCNFLADPSVGPGETGVMDLSSTGETKRAIFTAGSITLPALPSGAVQAAPSQPEEPAAEATPAPRSEDIPSGYLGDGSENSSSSEGGEPSPDDGGDSWYDDGGDSWYDDSGDSWYDDSGDGWYDDGGDSWYDDSGDGWYNDGGDSWYDDGGDGG